VTFINWTMLFGLLALAVPILIHLLNRSRARTVDWGAMRFLLASLTSQNRRILVEEIILLALRCLLVALAVLAVARPFLPTRSSVPWAVVLPAVLGAVVCLGVAGAMWSHRRARWALLGVVALLAALAAGASAFERWVQELKWASGRGERDVAILLDASLSMTLRVEGRTNFARAIEEARSVIDACRPGDAVSLVLAGPVPHAVVATPTADREELAAALEGLKPIGGTMSVLEALNVAAASLAEGNNASKKIVLITDGQNVGWDVRSEVRWRFLAEGLKNLPSQPRVICRTLPLPKRFRNAAVAEVGFSRKVVGTDRPVRVHVQVMNTGTATLKPSAVELSVDGAKVATERVLTAIVPKATETVSFEHRFTRPGPRLVTARVVGQDDLTADNQASRVLHVIDRLSVLVVDGTPSLRPLGGAAAFVEIALTPRGEEERAAAEQGEPGGPTELAARDLVEPRVVAAADIASVPSLSDYAVVVLANVPRVPAVVAERLVAFVQGGGGLLIAPGIRAKPTFYNAWATTSAEPVAPARLGERREVADSPSRLEPKSFTHPALRLLAGESGADIASALVKSYWRLEADERDAQVRVGARFHTGEPFVVERKLGKGYVLAIAAPLDPTGSNLPALKSFVPLVHELVYYLASPMMLESNVVPGSEATIELRERTGPGDAATGRGLRGEYFGRMDLTRPRASRVDATVDFDWGPGRPHPSVHADSFSVRWTGWVRPRFSERYTFHVVADDGVRLWVDGTRLVDVWKEQDAAEHSGSAVLTAGRRYKLRMEFYENSGNASAKLLWSSRSQGKQVIPRGQLYPALGPLEPGERGTGGGAADAGPSVAVLTPSQRRLRARVASGEGVVRVSFTDTQEPGLYTLLLPPELAELYAPGATASDADEGDAKALPFVVLSKVEESCLEPLTDADLDMAGQHVDLFETERTDELASAVAGGVPGEELWKYLAIGALLVLMAEIAVTRWIAVQRRLHTAEAVSFGSDAVDIQTFQQRAKQLLAMPADTPEGAARP